MTASSSTTRSPGYRYTTLADSVLLRVHRLVDTLRVMPSHPSVQSTVVRLDKALTAARQLFELYPKPRPVGAPQKVYRGIPPAVVQSVTAGFEAFAEELVVVVMLAHGHSWAQIAANANLTNPTLRTLSESLKHVSGIDVSRAGTWSLRVWRQSGAKMTSWSRTRSRSWNDVLDDADGWMQVRHCLTHGLVTGTEPAVWPGPVTRKSFASQAGVAAASHVLAESGTKRALRLYSALNAGLVYSHGAARIADTVAESLGEIVDTTKLTTKFDTV
ncbi:hypothetical protein ACGIF2_05950 [Cellulomonas sp. P22]